MHSYVQGKVLTRHGAVALGIINAMRAVVVTPGSAVLFCRPTAGAAAGADSLGATRAGATGTQQCLTMASGSSAVVVTSGAIMWALAPAPTKGAVSAHDKND